MGMKEKSLARCCKAVYAALPEENADAVMRGTRRHCDEVSGTGAAAIVFVLIQHLPDLISQRSPPLFLTALILY